VLFIGWTVMNSHYPALFLGGFLFFLGFAKATAPYQAPIDLRAPLLVGFFLGGLVIHGGVQGWWIAPVLSSLSEVPLFFGSTLLTAFNDNALITYLATLVPNLDERLKDRHRGGRGDRRRAHRDCQCPESGRAGAARTVLRWGHRAARAARRGDHSDGHRDCGVQGYLKIWHVLRATCYVQRAHVRRATCDVRRRLGYHTGYRASSEGGACQADG
jgi:hypothetical protein